MKHGICRIQRVFHHCEFSGGSLVHLVLQTFSHTTCRRKAWSCHGPFWYVRSVSWIQFACCICCKRSFQQLSVHVTFLHDAGTQPSIGTLDHIWSIWSSLKLCERTCVVADPHRRQKFCCINHRQSLHARSAHGFPDLLLTHKTFHRYHTLARSLVFHSLGHWFWLQIEASQLHQQVIPAIEICVNQTRSASPEVWLKVLATQCCMFLLPPCRGEEGAG